MFYTLPNSRTFLAPLKDADAWTLNHRGDLHHPNTGSGYLVV